MLLITQPRVGVSANEILALQISARELGWEVIPALYSWRLDKEIIDKQDIGICYGSQLFCEVISEQMNWKLKALPFNWLSKVPLEFLKRKVKFMTLAEAKIHNKYYSKFIKPADDKCFDAKVYLIDEFDPPSLLEDSTPVLVSEIVSWDYEYRCFISEDNKLQTWSNYIYLDKIADPSFYNKMIDINPSLLDFMGDLLNSGIVCGPAVIDVGIIPNKGWAVIETNPAWASGLYGCDAMSALQVIKQSIYK